MLKPRSPILGLPRWLTALLLLLLALALTSCGFRLRGQARLPPQMAVTYIAEERPTGLPPSDLATALARLLRASNVQVTQDSASATAVLSLLDQDLSRRTVAAAEEGDVRETTLRFAVRYALKGSDGQQLIEPTSYVISRDALYNEAQVLGANEGERITIRQMVEDTAFAIVRRLEAVGP